MAGDTFKVGYLVVFSLVNILVGGGRRLVCSWQLSVLASPSLSPSLCVLTSATYELKAASTNLTDLEENDWKQMW